jgi:hypothetical protein
MKFKPQKRVGSPASFRGVRGTYLTTMLMYVGGGLFLILILLIFPFSMLMRFILIVLVISLLLYKYNTLKKLSKGDLNKSLKSYCRKTFVIKPKKHETS